MRIDGKVEVQESWKGDLKEGARITIPELAEFAPEAKRAIGKRLFAHLDEEPAMKVSHVTGKRMILFLRKKQEKVGKGKPDKITWEPANLGRKLMDISIGWVEGDKVYAISQQVNPGPSEILYHGTTEAKLKERTQQIVKMQAALTKALSQSDPVKHLDVVKPLLDFDSYYVGGVTVEALGQSGERTLPVLRKILKEESWSRYHPDVCGALANAGGAKAGPDLTVVVEEELAFWKERGPGLKPNWWNGEGLEWTEVERLRHHFSKVDSALQALRKCRFPGCRDAVKAFRDCWQSLGKASISELTELSDEVLKKLP
jgi:hypothetical protein